MGHDEITGLVLAGGRGNRMGGLDKGLQSYRGVPLARWAAERLGSQVGAVMISANRHLDLYRDFNLPVCVDETPSFGGPLAGLLSGFALCRTPWMASVPCDVPRFPDDLVARLAETVQHQSADIAIASIDTPGGRRVQPVFALMNVRLEDSLRRFLRDGGTKVRDWMLSHDCVEAIFADETAFSNLNTLDELRLANRGA